MSICRYTVVSVIFSLAWQSAALGEPTTEQVEFFETRIRPVLVEHCYVCHNSTETAEAEVALDWRDAIRMPSEHGTAVVPGKPAESLLLKAIRHEIDGLEMPDGGPQLAPTVIADFEKWIQLGAADPRDQPPSAEELTKATSWEATLANRKRWWSFQPIASPDVPRGEQHPVDAFIRDRLGRERLEPAGIADRATLLRRLTFVLTGLPPSRPQMEEFAKLDLDVDYEKFVDGLLNSDAFGERWARHLMDLVRYTDSHGSEGDPSIPHAYQYRDYLIRALNQDVPYDQLLREHVAGDLLPNPRINDKLGINESAIGPAHWRMVFHGFAPTDALDEKVRFVDDQINVFSKAFLGLTVSCARCHDHKFDPISQADYYALFGVLGSCRPALVDVNTPDRQQMHVDRLRALKSKLRQDIANAWSKSMPNFVDKLNAENDVWKRQVEAADKPHMLLNLWHELEELTKEGKSFEQAWGEVATAWNKIEADAIEDRRRENRWYSNLANADHCQMWFPAGNGLPDEPYAAGDFVVATVGDHVIERVLPAGIHTNSVSAKHRGFLASKRLQLDEECQVWFHVAGQGEPSARYVVQHYPRDGTVYPIRSINKTDWYLLNYDLTYWTGDDVHFELSTARDAPITVRDKDNSWFALREVIVRKKAEPQPQRNAREFLAPIFATAEEDAPTSKSELAEIVGTTLSKAIQAWKADNLSDAQAIYLDKCIEANLLPNVAKTLDVKELLEEYRKWEGEIPTPTRVPGLAESEAWDQPLFDRGNHKRPMTPVARRFLEAIDNTRYQSTKSGRLELAEGLLHKDNPLTSRVIANRVWHHAFGRGLVATPDNFGKLGAKPSHPQLLDYLANRFVDDGWSIKRAIKLLVTSATWKALSQPSEAATLRDPENRLLSHANLRRLDAESIRDSLLSAAGRLDRSMFGAPVSPNGESARRSIYVRAKRNSLDQFLSVFNAPVPFSTKGRRDVTNVPAQSLTMLNDPFVRKLASLWAEGELARTEDRDEREIAKAMFETAFSRPPADAELESLVEYVARLAQRIEDNSVRRMEIDREIGLVEAQLVALIEPVRNLLKDDRNEPQTNVPAPFGHWDFELDLRDRVGQLHGKAHGGARIEGGALVLEDGAFVKTDTVDKQLREKTLVALVQLSTLEQGGGGAISVQTTDGVRFDSIVFAERQPKRWIAGSDTFARTEDLGGPEEASVDEVVHMAIAYDKDGTIRAYRNGQSYGRATRKGRLQAYQPSQWQVLIGLRHGDATRLNGKVFDAALYGQALSADQIAALALGRDYVSEQDVYDALSVDQRQRLSQLTDSLATLRKKLDELGEPVNKDEAWARLAHAMFNMKEFIYLR